MQPRQLVQAWVHAFNRADPDALAAFYAEDAVNHQVAEPPVRGREAIRRMFATGFASATMVCRTRWDLEAVGSSTSAVGRSCFSAATGTSSRSCAHTDYLGQTPFDGQGGPGHGQRDRDDIEIEGVAEV